MAVLYRSTSFYLLGIFICLITALAFFYLLVLRRKLNADVEIPIGIAQKDDKIRIKINIHNHKILGYRKMKFQVVYKSVSDRKYKKTWLLAKSIAHGHSQYLYDLEINRADYYEFKIRKVKYYDLLGIFCMSKRINSVGNILVFPDINPIPVSVGQRVINFFSDTDIYDEYHSGDDASEIFDIREYRQGDRLSNIHWKLSSKMDDLVVKENSLPRPCPAILFLNSNVNDGDNVIETIASFSFSMMDAGCAHYIAWISRYQKDITRMRVDDEESFYECLVSIMQDRDNSIVNDIAERYYDKYRNEHVLYEIMFDADKTLINGSLIEDVKHYEMVLG